MIRTKKDLEEYISADNSRYNLRMPMWAGLIVGNEPCHALHYLHCLRRYEYAYNNRKRNIFTLFRYLYRSLAWRRLSFKYKIFIGANKCGKGLYIAHMGGVLL